MLESLLSGLITGLAQLGAVLVGAYFTAYLDNRLAAAASSQTATTSMVGPGGLLQPLADALRLFFRRDNRLARADHLLFRSAPIVAFVAVFLVFSIVPWDVGLIGRDLNVGLFFFLAILGPVTIALMNATWGANSKNGVLAAYRAGAHLFSYEITIGFAIIGPVMEAQSLSMQKIVAGQGHFWYVVLQPLGFAIYFVSALIMSFRAPFDLPLAGSELAGGLLAEYSGARYGLYRLTLQALAFLLAAIGTALFLGGWQGLPLVGPFLPGWLWFLLKTFGLLALMLGVGYRLPRLRVDQMLALAWKILLPMALFNILLIGIISLFI